MKAVTKQDSDNRPATGRVAYDPRNLDPIDQQARELDERSEGIDWDEIIATTQEDWEAGRYKVFSSVDYPTDEALSAALKAWRDSVRVGDDL